MKLEENSSTIRLFPVTEEQVKQIYNIYVTNEEKIQEDIRIVNEWWRKQPHLPQKYPGNSNDDTITKHILLHDKFRVESAKVKIETHFTMRTLNADFYQQLAQDGLPIPSKLSVTVLPLPKLGPNLERICVLQISKFRPFDLDHLLQSFLTFCELDARYDDANGIMMIFDCRSYNFESFKRTDLARFARIMMLLLRGYSSRITGIHVISSLPFASFCLGAVKTIMKQKILERVRFHKSLDSLHECLSKEYLPVEYEGNAGSLQDILDVYDKVFQAHHHLWKDSANYKINEDLRVGSLVDGNMFGVDGTFKKLTID